MVPERDGNLVIPTVIHHCR